jgi:hypothetical protein
VSRIRRILTSPTLVRGVEFWALFAVLFALAQALAEFHLASFGVPGMRDLHDWNLATTFAYAIRHWVALALFFLLFVAIVFFPAWVFLALFNASARRLTARLLAITACLLILVVDAASPAHQIRRLGFQRAAVRMAPLVEAIRRFETQTGRPPDGLYELTPRYFASIQEFGVRGCYPLQYTRAGDDANWRWQLQVQCPNGMLSVDQFFLHAAGDYQGWGHAERIGAWAYVWD